MTRAAVLVVLLSRVAAADEPVELKNEKTAIGLSVAGTALSAGFWAYGHQTRNDGLLAAGLLTSLFTPSLGHWYAGDALTVGLGIRAASAAVFVMGVSEAARDDTRSDAGALIGMGLLGYATGILYDIATAPRAARTYNERHRVAATFAPAVLTPPSGPVIGVGLGGRF